MGDIDTIYKKSAKGEFEEISENRYLNRAEFQLYIIRLAVLLYCDNVALKRNLEMDMDDENCMQVVKAVDSLFKLKIEKLLDEKNFKW